MKQWIYGLPAGYCSVVPKLRSIFSVRTAKTFEMKSERRSRTMHFDVVKWSPCRFAYEQMKIMLPWLLRYIKAVHAKLPPILQSHWNATNPEFEFDWPKCSTDRNKDAEWGNRNDGLDIGKFESPFQRRRTTSVSSWKTCSEHEDDTSPFRNSELRPIWRWQRQFEYFSRQRRHTWCSQLVIKISWAQRSYWSKLRPLRWPAHEFNLFCSRGNCIDRRQSPPDMFTDTRAHAARKLPMILQFDWVTEDATCWWQNVPLASCRFN